MSDVKKNTKQKIKDKALKYYRNFIKTVYRDGERATTGVIKPGEVGIKDFDLIYEATGTFSFTNDGKIKYGKNLDTLKFKLFLWEKTQINDMIHHDMSFAGLICKLWMYNNATKLGRNYALVSQDNITIHELPNKIKLNIAFLNKETGTWMYQSFTFNIGS